MLISNLVNAILVTAMACTPLWTDSGEEEIQVHEADLSVVTDSPCYSHQPDLLVGKLVYYKGKATVNGTEPKAGSYLHYGDVLNTSLDGFAALELRDGTVLSIQPATQLSLVCNPKTTVAKNKASFKVGMPYMSGAVRG